MSLPLLSAPERVPVFRLTDNYSFPPGEWADADGLLAVGGDLSPQRLLLGYANGIFPWYSPGEPLLWWSPTPRAVIFPGGLHIARRLLRTMRCGRWRITFDTCCREVIRACAVEHGSCGTWITPEMAEAYGRLHELGYVHSVECWRDGELAGGLYGVALGYVFFGESMFHRCTDASKIALTVLVQQLFAAGYRMFDCQLPTAHLARLGATELERSHFMTALRKAGIAALPPYVPGWFPAGELALH